MLLRIGARRSRQAHTSNMVGSALASDATVPPVTTHSPQGPDAGTSQLAWDPHLEYVRHITASRRPAPQTWSAVRWRPTRRAGSSLLGSCTVGTGTPPPQTSPRTLTTALQVSSA